jgi:hypothetical protein
MQGTSSTYTGGVNCHNSRNGKPKQEFSGWMAYTRFWFKKDLYAVTLGGGQMNNPGRYLVLLPPINNATASTGTPYFTENAGDRAQMHDGTVTFDYMPSQYITFRAEESYRYSDVPYWSGRGGITPPGGKLSMRRRWRLRRGLHTYCRGRPGGVYDRTGAGHCELHRTHPEQRRQWHQCSLVARPAHQPDLDYAVNYGSFLKSLNRPSNVGLPSFALFAKNGKPACISARYPAATRVVEFYAPCPAFFMRSL